MTTSHAMHIEAELQPNDGKPVYGVTYDGEQLWVAGQQDLRAIDPQSGELLKKFEIACDAGTAFDGRYLYQLAADHIHKIAPESGEVLSSIPAPGKGKDSGLTWAEGMLWVGQYRDRKIHQIDPDTGEVLRTIESDRFVTGVTWVEGELWHGVMEGEVCELRRVDPETSEVTARLTAPEGAQATGLSSDGRTFFCGGGNEGKVRIIRRPA